MHDRIHFEHTLLVAERNRKRRKHCRAYHSHYLAREIERERERADFFFICIVCVSMDSGRSSLILFLNGQNSLTLMQAVCIDEKIVSLIHSFQCQTREKRTEVLLLFPVILKCGDVIKKKKKKKKE